MTGEIIRRTKYSKLTVFSKYRSEFRHKGIFFKYSKALVQNQKFSILSRNNKNSLFLEFQMSSTNVSWHLEFLARCPQQTCLKDKVQKKIPAPHWWGSPHHPVPPAALSRLSWEFAEMFLNLWRFPMTGSTPSLIPSLAHFLLLPKSVFYCRDFRSLTSASLKKKWRALKLWTKTSAL